MRQLIEQSGFYWLDKAQRGNFKSIKNLSFVGAMNHPGGGRNDIPNRLKRQFFTYNMIPPLSIEMIYGPIVRFQFRLDAKNSGLPDEVTRHRQQRRQAARDLADGHREAKRVHREVGARVERRVADDRGERAEEHGAA